MSGSLVQEDKFSPFCADTQYITVEAWESTAGGKTDTVREWDLPINYISHVNIHPRLQMVWEWTSLDCTV